MNIILLSGGSGKRLWPLSNEIRSKQFIRIFQNEYGKYESMVQRVYRQICSINHSAKITIATSKKQVSVINNQLGNKVNICVEPYRKDTFPAIALASTYLYDVLNVPTNETIIICPVDSYVDDFFFKKVFQLGKLVENGEANLYLMGIEPTYPSEKYGYIIPTKNCELSEVKTFKEKPSKVDAEKYIKQGALWNGGVFACKLAYILEKVHELVYFKNYEDLFIKYKSLPKISFDYAVVEKEQMIQVLRFAGKWKDIGTWNTLTEEMNNRCIGDVRFNDTCKNVHVLNELGVPILCMGLKNTVVSASPEGILVSDKTQSSYIKPYVEQINQQVMFGEKSWGSFKVLDIEEESMTIKIILNPKHQMNYHSHEHRDEIWAIIKGKGKTIISKVEQIVKSGDVITIPAGCPHTIIAETELQLIEIQLGNNISVYDKQKYKLEDRL